MDWNCTTMEDLVYRVLAYGAAVAGRHDPTKQDQHWLVNLRTGRRQVFLIHGRKAGEAFSLLDGRLERDGVGFVAYGRATFLVDRNGNAVLVSSRCPLVEKALAAKRRCE